MKPDAYMPFYGADFEQATKGYNAQIKWSYVAALWHYWHQHHTDGLPDDDEYLRNICDCESAVWVRTKGIIFGVFFKLEAGKWHQKRAREDYKESIESYTAAVERGRRGADARWTKQSSSNAQALEQAMPKQWEPEPEPEPVDKQTIQTPPLSEVKALGQIIGMPESECEAFWNHFESSGWIDKNGNTIKNWQAKQRTWKVSSQAAPLEKAHHAGSTGANTIILGKEYERILARMQNLRATYADHQEWTAKDRAELAKLKTRRDELKKILRITV